MRKPLVAFEQHPSAAWMRFQEVAHPQVLATPESRGIRWTGSS